MADKQQNFRKFSDMNASLMNKIHFKVLKRVEFVIQNNEIIYDRHELIYCEIFDVE